MKRKFVVFLLLATFTAVTQNTPSVSGAFFDVGGVKLWYQECGAANPTSIVLLHDGLLHSITWDQVWAPLCAKYHVLRYDRRGYGRSEPSKGSFVPEDDLLKIMRQVDMNRAILVGNSSGGGLAIDFTLAHPESVSALFLIGTVVHGMPTSDFVSERGARNSAPMEKDDVRATAENWSKDRFIISGDSPAARKSLYDGLVQNPQNLRYANGLEIRPSPPPPARLSHIRVPTLLLDGDADIPDVFLYSGAVMAAAPLARYEVWKDTGHMIQLQRPKELVERFDRFVTIALRKEVELPEPTLKQYVGSYTCFGHPSGVLLIDHQLVFEFPGTPYIRLFPMSETRFFARTTSAEIEFERDKTTVSKMVIHNSDGSRIECPVRAAAD